MPASQYCQPSDLASVLAPAALASTTNAQQQAACVAASERADSYLRGRYGVSDGRGGYAQPLLIAWGSDLTLMVSYVAAYLLMEARGFNPNAGADAGVLRRYYEAIGNPNLPPGNGWFPSVQRQAIHPDVTPNSSMLTNSGADLPQVRSGQLRGWGQTNGSGVPSV
jgi:hypothetical protein